MPAASTIVVAIVLLVLLVLLALVVMRSLGGVRSTGGADDTPAGPAVEVNFGPEPPPIDPAAVRDATAAAIAAAPGFAPAHSDDPRIQAVATRFGLAPGAVASLRTMEIARRAGPAMHRARANPQLAREFAEARRAGPAALVAAAARARVPASAALKMAGGGPANAAENAALADADIGSRGASEYSRELATKFERDVAAVLAAQRVEFRTEDDLRAESAAAGAPPPALTPDFLIAGVRRADGSLAPATFRGRPLRWADAKNYPGTGHSLTAAKIERSAHKYAEAFGPGVFVFAGGVVSGYAPAPGRAIAIGFGGARS